MAPPTDAEVM
uniref:Uncharacterized protein n=1 Tax=Arundo donax TaxID=35708 RepID=A0A0A9FQZ1_ARUDO